MQTKQKTQGFWKKFFAAKSSLYILLFLLVSCGNEIPSCEKCKIWATDSNSGSIKRAQDNQEIFATDPEFDNFKCMSDEALEAFVDTYINGCKEWRRETVPLRENEAFRQNKKQLKKVLKNLKKKE